MLEETETVETDESQETPEVETKEEKKARLYTESDKDKKVSEALATQERKLRERFEDEKKQLKLQKSGEFEKLWQEERLKREQMEFQSQTSRYLADNALTELTDLIPEFKSLDAVKVFAERYKEVRDLAIEKEVKERFGKRKNILPENEGMIQTDSDTGTISINASDFIKQRQLAKQKQARP